MTAALSGVTKAAILLVILGEDAASDIYRHLPPGEVEQITKEIAGLQYVDSATGLQVLEEFHRLVVTGDYISQ
jgi:flagellar motor switch protein FliG